MIDTHNAERAKLEALEQEFANAPTKTIRIPTSVNPLTSSGAGYYEGFRLFSQGVEVKDLPILWELRRKALFEQEKTLPLVPNIFEYMEQMEAAAIWGWYDKEERAYFYSGSLRQMLTGKKVKTSPGKIFQKMDPKGCIFSKDGLTKLAQESYTYTGATAFRIQYAKTPKEIAAVYSMETGAFNSCMQYKPGHWQGPRGHHPTEAYGAGDLAVAYVLDNTQRLHSRALVWPDKGKIGRIYGSQHILLNALREDGWDVDGYYPYDTFEGARVHLIPYPSTAQPEGDGPAVVFLPYIDGGNSNMYGVRINPENTKEGFITTSTKGRYIAADQGARIAARTKCKYCIDPVEHSVYYQSSNEASIETIGLCAEHTKSARVISGSGVLLGEGVDKSPFIENGELGWASPKMLKHLGFKWSYAGMHYVLDGIESPIGLISKSLVPMYGYTLERAFNGEIRAVQRRAAEAEDARAREEVLRFLLRAENALWPANY